MTAQPLTGAHRRALRRVPVLKRSCIGQTCAALRAEVRGAHVGHPFGTNDAARTRAQLFVQCSASDSTTPPRYVVVRALASTCRVQGSQAGARVLQACAPRWHLAARHRRSGRTPCVPGLRSVLRARICGLVSRRAAPRAWSCFWPPVPVVACSSAQCAALRRTVRVFPPAPL